MELEEMQTLWSTMSEQIDQKVTLSKTEIMEMTQKRYQQKLNQIAYPELLGSIICFGMVGFIFINLDKLNDVLSLLATLLSLIILIALPTASLLAIKRLRAIDVSQHSYQQSLLTYTKAKQHLCQVQKYGLYLGFVLMFSILPFFTKVMGEELEATSILKGMLFGVPFLIVFVLIVARYYGKTIRATENIIRDLED
ncbi:MAG: hypothetical protein AAF806_18020 [Bacteroidota bacterium]